jgi:hypothetical protein
MSNLHDSQFIFPPSALDLDPSWLPFSILPHALEENIHNPFVFCRGQVKVEGSKMVTFPV